MLNQQNAIKLVRSYIYELTQSGVNFEKAILYGSYSKNLQTSDSDIDIALVSDMFSGFAYEDRKLIADINIKNDYIDMDVRTINSTAFRNGNPFFDEIISTGIEIN